MNGENGGYSPKKINSGGLYNPDDILAQIISINGLFEKVFGKLLKPLVYNATVSNGVHILETVYGFKDARKVFPEKIIKSEFDRVSETVFRIVKNDQGTNIINNQ